MKNKYTLAVRGVLFELLQEQAYLVEVNFFIDYFNIKTIKGICLYKADWSF